VFIDGPHEFHAVAFQDAIQHVECDAVLVVWFAQVSFEFAEFLVGIHGVTGFLEFKTIFAIGGQDGSVGFVAHGSDFGEALCNVSRKDCGLHVNDLFL
jgi:hypothetical protein